MRLQRFVLQSLQPNIAQSQICDTSHAAPTTLNAKTLQSARAGTAYFHILSTPQRQSLLPSRPAARSQGYCYILSSTTNFQLSFMDQVLNVNRTGNEANQIRPGIAAALVTSQPRSRFRSHSTSHVAALPALTRSFRAQSVSSLASCKPTVSFERTKPKDDTTSSSEVPPLTGLQKPDRPGSLQATWLDPLARMSRSDVSSTMSPVFQWTSPFSSWTSGMLSAMAQQGSPISDQVTLSPCSTIPFWDGPWPGSAWSTPETSALQTPVVSARGPLTSNDECLPNELDPSSNAPWQLSRLSTLIARVPGLASSISESDEVDDSDNDTDTGRAGFQTLKAKLQMDLRQQGNQARLSPCSVSTSCIQSRSACNPYAQPTEPVTEADHHASGAPRSTSGRKSSRSRKRTCGSIRNHRPHRCDYCPLSFVRRYDLHRHRRLHTAVMYTSAKNDLMGSRWSSPQLIVAAGRLARCYLVIPIISRSSLLNLGQYDQRKRTFAAACNTLQSTINHGL
ncbi:uncharacterized protein L969DRAFT_93648 [Mixia osmundae IAM 14324]|uniref:uncharacterized protein n=1 Tax=Mixia osmundae (strain CBS 9802 / IAM 14324 / JCM 22182 / KY 12970) TaxID=764103 RepID=UPI0004A549F6|nr:uncharacterized protein L969DRAFT_93648 [Mixia osmundae IAM 14324]KEI39807.1 hypothetical protein L969DRAFT_93648 [Mixia osmundae IAM 14324]